MNLRRALLLVACALPLSPALADTATPASAPPAPKPAAIVADGVPVIPATLVAATQPYLQARNAAFLGWDEKTRGMLVKTRFGNTDQLHTVSAPGAAREQVSFEGEPVLTGSLSPGKGDVTLVQKDVGGGEFYQLFRLEAGRLRLLTDGKSRNWFGAWSRDGRYVGYSSTRRNGADADLYMIDPRDPNSDRKLAEVKGGGWNIADFSPDGRRALVLNRQSINKADLYEMDVATGAMRAITDTKAQVSYEAPHYAPDGKLWVISDEGADFLRLGRLDPKTGGFMPVSREPKWDVSDYTLSPDGGTIAYATNEAGVSRLHVLDTRTNAVRAVTGLPAGVIPWSIGPAMQISPWGAIGLSVSSARVAGDVFSVDSKTLAVTRWTKSETGGLDPSRNVEPVLVEVKSFDGQLVSGFLYRPDPSKFPGKRPLIIDIHGGPEGQTRPDFLGATNYAINELGIAVFYPNVRGSSGFGKRFVNLDNGPFKREDSVKDIGAFLDALAKDPTLDATRFAVNGVSYGGYMCYATATHYSARLKGANCYVAISNFVTFLQNTQDYRRDLRRVEYGDERDLAQRAQLMKISPLTSVNRITVPLLVATGGNDPRVPRSEAEQMVSAVRANGGTAWHLIAQNEGHVFHKKENEDYYFWTSMLFWQRTLLSGAPQ
ncbi:prolyl oligopeptidase family serine peptidase [uncultured Sphingomonas sp.]|uniref:S9 family peptidase n=1 Tax=uncultured Sphingomonas sp. TaxID=158754 RepID=UPI0025D63972|nr:prolyl oligopeptidase family serine peptidase [uncultured Sphingomonas sp.]